MFTLEDELQPTQIGLMKNLLWDVLQISWPNIKVLFCDKPIQDITMALKDKLRVCKTIAT